MVSPLKRCLLVLIPEAYLERMVKAIVWSFVINNNVSLRVVITTVHSFSLSALTTTNTLNTKKILKYCHFAIIFE